MLLGRLSHRTEMFIYHLWLLTETMVQYITRRDGKSSVTFTLGRLRTLSTILSAAALDSINRRCYAPGDLSSREKGAALTLSLLCRRKYSFSYGRSHRVAYDLPLETWVLGPASNEQALFQHLFRDLSSPRDYRIFLHWTPQHHNGSTITPLWKEVYHLVVSPVRALKDVPRDGEEPIQSFLKDLLRAYAEGDHAVELAIRETAHPFWNSRLPAERESPERSRWPELT